MISVSPLYSDLSGDTAGLQGNCSPRLVGTVPPAGAGGRSGLSLSQSLRLPTALGVLGSWMHPCSLSLCGHVASPCESGSVHYLSSVSSFYFFQYLFILAAPGLSCNMKGL